jgi:hypothetical protein
MDKKRDVLLVVIVLLLTLVFLSLQTSQSNQITGFAVKEQNYVYLPSDESITEPLLIEETISKPKIEDSLKINTDSCGVLSTSLTLSNNVSSETTCFEINENNLILDCANYTITYATNGTGGKGVIVSGQNNITIKNCKLKEGLENQTQDAIYLNNVNNSLIEHNNINTSTNGVRFNNSNNIILLNNVVVANNTFNLSGQNLTIIYNNSYGKIVWAKNTFFTKLNSTQIIIDNNLISLNDENDFNSLAQLTFYSLPYSTTPHLLKNNLICDHTNDCNITYSAGTLEANITGFSNYSTSNISVPVLLIPEDNSTIIGQLPIFVWNNSGPDYNYTILIDDNINFNNPEVNETIEETNVINSTYSLNSYYTLKLNTVYYWKVRAENGSIKSLYSDSFNFTITSYGSLNITETQLLPELDISLFSPYTFKANLTNLTTVDKMIVNISGLNGEGGYCWDYYINGTCGSENLIFEMDYIDNLWQKSNIYPDYIYPEIYFTTSEITWNNQPLNYSIKRDSYHLFNFTNSFVMDNNMSFWVELDVVPQSTTQSETLYVYLVGKDEGLSYFESDWRGKSKTQLIGSLLRDATFHHTHSSNSSHYLFPLTTNSDGTIGQKNINVSENFWVVLYSDTSNLNRRWNLKYHSNSLCNNTNAWYVAERSGNTWNTPVTEAGCPDVHIHVARRENIVDGVNMNIFVNDTNGESIYQDNQFYFNDLPNLAPLRSSFTNPINSTYSGFINITWLPSTDPNNDVVTYNLSLLNFDGSFNKTLIGSTILTSYYWDSRSVNNGVYTLMVEACDPSEECVNWTQSSSYGNFTVFSAPELLSPSNNDYIIDRTPLFVWNNSGSGYNYTILVDDNPTFNNPEINETVEEDNVINSSYQVISPYILDLDTVYYWKVRAENSSIKSLYSEPFNFTLESYAAINVVNDTIDFGSVNNGNSYNTTNPLYNPFIIENIGNIVINLTITSTPVFSSVSYPSEYYLFKIRENESNSYTDSTSTWTQFNNVSSSIDVENLNWEIANNNFMTDLLITIPLSEIAGQKSSTITFSQT